MGGSGSSSGKGGGGGASRNALGSANNPVSVADLNSIHSKSEETAVLAAMPVGTVVQVKSTAYRSQSYKYTKTPDGWAYSSYVEVEKQRGRGLTRKKVTKITGNNLGSAYTHNFWSVKYPK